MLFAIATLVVAIFFSNSRTSDISSGISYPCIFGFSVYLIDWLRRVNPFFLGLIETMDIGTTRYGRNNTTVVGLVNVPSREFLPLHVWRVLFKHLYVLRTSQSRTNGREVGFLVSPFN